MKHAVFNSRLHLLGDNTTVATHAFGDVLFGVLGWGIGAAAPGHADQKNYGSGRHRLTRAHCAHAMVAMSGIRSA